MVRHTHESLERLVERAEMRARRLALAAATWGARGLDDASGGRTVQSELQGFAQEIRVAGLGEVAALLEAAAHALSCLEAVGGEEAPLFQGRRVLVLDDSEVTADLIALALEGAGCVVSVALSVAEAVEEFESVRAEALILEPAHPDFATPEDVLALQRRLKADVLPIILFSAEPPERLAPVAQLLSADSHVSKDQGLAGLIEQVTEVLSGVLW